MDPVPTERTAAESNGGPGVPDPVMEPFKSGFGALFEQHLDYVVHSLRRLGVREAEVEDVAQDVFLAVHARFDQLDLARPVRPWLFAFARRAAANHRRLARHSRELPGSQLGPARADEEDPEAWADRSQRIALVHDVLLRMPEELRVTLIMSDLDGFTATQISEVLGAPVGTVYSRVKRAREEFRRLLRRRLGPGAPGKEEAR